MNLEPLIVDQLILQFDIAIFTADAYSYNSDARLSGIVWQNYCYAICPRDTLIALPARSNLARLQHNHMV